MRKILALLLCIAMLCSLVVITAQADTTTAMACNDVIGVANGTVYVTLNIENTPGISAINLAIVDNDGLSAEFAMVDNDADELALTANDAGGQYLWKKTTSDYTTTFGTLGITIPDGTPNGDYTFTVAITQALHTEVVAGKAVNTATTVNGTTFTVTVTDKVITGVNIAIDASTSIGIHVQTSDPENTSITAVNVAGAEFATITDYEEDEENGGYVYYLKVNPWAMDAEFVVDFTENFVINDKDDDNPSNDELDLDQIPATAKTTGILKYCEKLLTMDPSDELKQLVADLLEFGRQAQTYQGVAVMDLPAGLTPTEAEWLDGEDNPTTFGAYCSENFSETQAKGNATAAKKFKFASAKIEFGAQFVVTFDIDNNGTTTAFSNARMVVDGTTYSLDEDKFTYAFSAKDYAGIDFVLYASSNTNNTNKCWTNNYGPAYFAAYRYDNDEEVNEALMDLFEAFYNYGVSVEAYAATLSE